MPLLPPSDYKAPWFLPGGHLQTIVPSLTREMIHVTEEKERLELEDGDFLDLEWHRKKEPSDKLVIFCHGLEANAGASYVQEIAGALARKGWDALAWSFRGCSGERNRLPRFYHSGATEDLVEVVNHVLKSHPAKQIDFVGFSLGGNLILKYLGEQGEQASPRLGRAVAFSVPCDLADSAEAMDTFLNREIYTRRFMQSLSRTIREKEKVFPDEMDSKNLAKIRTFHEFDNHYTAPLHGFTDAKDYWKRSSSRFFMEKIRIPALLVNAENDPFLGPGCLPRAEAEASSYFYLEVTKEGGHVGFPGNFGRESWISQRVLRFFERDSRSMEAP